MPKVLTCRPARARRSSFTSHSQPFPIVLANSLTSRDNGTQFIEPDQFVPLQNPIYEFNVCESRASLCFRARCGPPG